MMLDALELKSAIFRMEAQICDWQMEQPIVFGGDKKRKLSAFEQVKSLAGSAKKVCIELDKQVQEAEAHAVFEEQVKVDTVEDTKELAIEELEEDEVEDEKEMVIDEQVEEDEDEDEKEVVIEEHVKVDTVEDEKEVVIEEQVEEDGLEDEKEVVIEEQDKEDEDELAEALAAAVAALDAEEVDVEEKAEAVEEDVEEKAKAVEVAVEENEVEVEHDDAESDYSTSESEELYL